MNKPIPRRTLLTTSASALAIAAACPSMSLLEAPKAQAIQPTIGPAKGLFRFGLVTYLWGQHMDLPTVIEACKKSGLEGVELRTQHKHGVEPILSKAQRSEVKKRFEDSGVILVGYGSNAEFHANDPAKLRSNIDQAKEFIQLMHDCGGSGVKVKPNAFVDGVPHEKTIEQIGKSLNELAAYGADYGQQIRVEVHGPGTSELPVIRDIFQIADHPNVGVCWNSNDEDLHGQGLEANFNMVVKRFGQTCHVRELNDPKYPYRELFRLLRIAEYRGWVLLEARTDPADKVLAMAEQRKIFDDLSK